MQVTAVAGLGGFVLTGPDLSPDHPVPTVAAPAALRALVPPAGLAALHWSGQDEERAELLRVLTSERAAG
ncbi:hypothetical protein BJF78_33205 [Pseudonocardia sp. CNS-139]|nr:hypothetical protein BJF78_33205 [Pseudonocardia sp. CNS-139]